MPEWIPKADRIVPSGKARAMADLQKAADLQMDREAAEKILNVGLNIAADQVRAELERVQSDEATGQLLNSLGTTPIKMDRNGNWNGKVGFHGYDKNGVPNQLKARVMESGTSKRKKRPFIRPALNKCRQAAEEAMIKAGEEIIRERLEE